MNKKTLQFLLLTSLCTGSFIPTQAGINFNSSAIIKKISQKESRRLAKEKKHKKLANMQNERSSQLDSEDYDMGLDTGYRIEKIFTTSLLAVTAATITAYLALQ